MAYWHITLHGKKGSNNIHVYSSDGKTSLGDALSYDGLPWDIEIYDLRGFTWGPDGNLYVGNSRKPYSQILQFTPSGDHYYSFDPGFLIQGSEGSQTALDHPYSVIFGPDGNLYVSNQNTNLVSRYYGPDSNQGTPGDPMPSMLEDFPPGTFVSLSSEFSIGRFSIRGITFGPDQNLYVADRDKDTIRVYNGETGAPIPDLDITSSNSVTIDKPIQVLFDENDVLYIGSSRNDAVVTYDSSNGLAYLVGPKATNLNAPSGMAFDGGAFYVASRKTNTILKYDPTETPPLQKFIVLSDGHSAADNPEYLVFH